MNKVLWALLALTAILTGSLFISCGETDPALAPAGAQITILNAGYIWSYNCTYSVPSICFEGMKKYMQRLCVSTRMDAGDSQAEAEYDCVTGGDWVDFADDEKNQEDYAKMILGDEDACGSLNNIITAYVSNEVSTSTTTGSEEGATVGSAEAMNDVEVRFIAINGEMYKLSDISGSVPPLANPYITRTDDRGKAEVKYLTHFPTSCGSVVTYILQADVGISQASVTYEFQVEDAETSDDDTTTDDDDDTA